MTNVADKILLNAILVEDRLRSDLGDLQSLIDSIKEYGIIQPIVITRELRLIAGGRRYASLQKLYGDSFELQHGKHFVFNDEIDPLRLQAMELEENLKRADLHWSEIVLGEQRLLKTMQELKGIGGSGRKDGFSQKSLASMLGMHVTQVSRDLDLAYYIGRHPDLAKMPTRYDAQRKLGIAVSVATMQAVVKHRAATAAKVVDNQNFPLPTSPTDGNPISEVAPVVPPQEAKLWQLYKGDFFENVKFVADSTCDLILTDLPYNIGLGDSSAAHGAGLGKFNDTITDPIAFYGSFAAESYRILHDNRFCVVFFGFADYALLCSALGAAGFTIDSYPFIWLRDRTAPPDGSRRYSKVYDPALICSKGDPRFVRPNQVNFMQCASVRGPDRLHSAQKPVEVMARFILDMTVEGAVVVDPMAGAGSTGVAAVQNKRQCLLFELEQENCVLIESRLSVL